MHGDAITTFGAFRASYPAHVQAGESMYLEATSALANDRDDRAPRLFRQFEESYPAHPKASSAQLRLAQHFLDKGETEKARRQLRSISKNPSSPAQAARALYLLGKTDQEQGNLKTALNHFRDVSSQYPETDVAPAALYATGEAHVQLEQYDRAASAFEELGERYPRSGFAQNLGTALAEVYYRLDEYESAANELETRLPELSGSSQARALFLLAESYNQLGRGEEAIVRYRRVIDDHSSSPYVAPARYGLAWHYQRSGQFEEAADAFARVRRASDRRLSKTATYYEAVNLARTNAWDEAVDRYQAAAEGAPRSRLASEALYEAGLIRYQQEQYGSAAAFFRRVTRDHPKSPRAGDAHYWLGNAYMAQDDISQALDAYTRAVKQEAAPDSVLVEARFQKAWALYTNQQYSEAASNFLSLANTHPEAPRAQEARFWAGDSYYQRENYARARTLFGKYLRETPNGAHAAGARYALAWSHFKENQYREAAKHFQSFLEAYDSGTTDVPYRQDAQLRLGDSYFALKQYDDAVTAYRRVGGTGTDYALYQAGEALNYAGREDEAIRTLRRLLQNYPESQWRPEARYRLASIYFQQQNYEQAREAYREFLDNHPDHPLAAEAQYGIGDSFYNAGQMTDAVDAYQTVLNTYPESRTANEAASSLFFALNAANQSDRAEELISSLVENNPDADLRDRLEFHRAKAAFQSGDSEKALRLFRAFVRTSSNESYLPRSYYHLGLLYADQDSPTEAKNYLQQLVERYPESEVLPDGALRLGDIYLEEETYEAALDAYRAAAESKHIGNELRAQALYGQGVALLKLDRNDEARELLDRTLEQEQGGPLAASAKLGLGRIHQNENRTDEALDLYRSVSESADSETGAEALYRLGVLLRKQGRPKNAIQELDRMSSLFAGYPTWIARSLLEQARAYQDMGQPGQADQLYDQVMTSYSGTPYAETAKRERQSL